VCLVVCSVATGSVRVCERKRGHRVKNPPHESKEKKEEEGMGGGGGARETTE
jgi:hypothetical protein